MEHVHELSREPLEKILTGNRKIEPVFTREEKAPYKNVAENDIIYFKLRDGYAVAKATVKKVENYNNLTPEKAKQLIEDHEEEILPENRMLERDIYFNYATLIWLEKLFEIKPFRVKKGNGEFSNWTTIEDINLVRE
ncbi:MAG: ASCH domain-containing protein [Thermoplasmata archaeon]|nr:ASCH domain-containing protein [Thermoplasmata archaeon]